MDHQSMTFLRALLAVAALATLVGCKIDVDIEGGVDGFACTTDADCVEGFICDNIGQPEGSVGRCVDATDPGEVCVDVDQDGAYTGPDCRPGQPIDCDDNNNAVGPQAVEICDGQDNNCDGATDEDLPEQPCPLQVGLCGGTSRACVDGAYADCAATGLYGPDFEQTEASCDGIDNDCDGSIDENCDCVPGEDEAFECGVNTGACTRGLQFCNDDGSLSPCVRATLGRVCDDGAACASDADCIDGSACAPEICTTSDDCRDGGLCVDEWLEDREDYFDDCEADDETGCRRTVCRYMAESVECTDDTGCLEDEACVLGSCRRRVVTAIEETCNGLDDDCNGAIDDDFRRADICGPCPYNMAFLSIVTNSGTHDFVCVDWYEASRPDATATSAGTIELYTLPRAGVVPWTGMTPEIAETVCRAEPLREAAGGTRNPVATKRLCKTFEWRQACGGKTGTTDEADYPYTLPGDPDVYIAGACTDAALGLTAPAVTGDAEACCRADVCDTSGNVAEYVKDASNLPVLAGGSFRDNDPEVLSCGDGTNYEPVPVDVTSRDDIGFRCCTLRAR